MTSDDVLDLLQQAYMSEVETIMNYISCGVSLHGVRAEEISESLLADVQEELNHAQLLAERINTLGGVPPGSFDFEGTQASMQPPESRTNVIHVIRGVLDAEASAIRTYRKLIVAAQDADDYVTEDLAIRLLDDEESHYTEFYDYSEEYDVETQPLSEV